MLPEIAERNFPGRDQMRCMRELEFLLLERGDAQDPQTNEEDCRAKCDDPCERANADGPGSHDAPSAGRASTRLTSSWPSPSCSSCWPASSHLRSPRESGNPSMMTCSTPTGSAASR